MLMHDSWRRHFMLPISTSLILLCWQPEGLRLHKCNTPPPLKKGRIYSWDMWELDNTSPSSNIIGGWVAIKDHITSPYLKTPPLHSRYLIIIVRKKQKIKINHLLFTILFNLIGMDSLFSLFSLFSLYSFFTGVLVTFRRLPLLDLVSLTPSLYFIEFSTVIQDANWVLISANSFFKS